MEEFRIEDYPSILNCLKHYYVSTGKEKTFGKPFEDFLYKANELFECVGDGHIGFWHLDTIEEYFGVPAYDYLLSRQGAYMHEDCKQLQTKDELRQYLHSFYLRNGAIKFHVEEFRKMVSVML